MNEEIKDPLETALWVPESLKQHTESNDAQEIIDPKYLSDAEHAKLLLSIQKKLVEHGIHITDLNQITLEELANVIKRLLEGKAINNSVQSLKTNFVDEGPIDHDAIEADSVDIHKFSVEAIEAKRTDELIHALMILMEHAAAKGKHANLAVEPKVEEEAIAEIEPITETPQPFLHQIEKKVEEKHTLEHNLKEE